MHRTASLSDAIEAASARVLPPRAVWWAHLTDGARHAILRDLDGPFPVRVIREIERAAGCTVREDAQLGDDDRLELHDGIDAVAC